MDAFVIHVAHDGNFVTNLTTMEETAYPYGPAAFLDAVSRLEREHLNAAIDVHVVTREGCMDVPLAVAKQRARELVDASHRFDDDGGYVPPNLLN